VGQKVVAPFLWQKKIMKIHYLVLSHPQADHMNGLPFIARIFGPIEFWHNGVGVENPLYWNLMDIIEQRGIKKEVPSLPVQSRNINGVRVECMHAPKVDPTIHAHELNNGSLVLRLSYGGKSFLFPGDIEQKAEAVLVSHVGAGLKSHVLLSPHHGSRTASSRAFLRMVQPRCCVISSGEGNRFGFPHAQTLERLDECHCAVLRIDRCGAIQCAVTRDRLRISTFLKGPVSVFERVESSHLKPLEKKEPRFLTRLNGKKRGF